ncbi:NfeD family protein [Nocardia puris]|uniref:Membrane protein implicated in regulation of membrane protease activity n=1 Tax=Nocardia puris TaxID=208602 RepID=A0A366DZ23_9NOCA|nr:NfeD family protein [Nocardia puris]MBF6209805.1 NfeD family protein [Nocardia puris]MBF6366377.1 NfeD family protein [Nocardia puris]MBF6458284.1 NfeD family protein [Nocardia puris]RBO94458.1 membrane protein implicated in regulation of membrane protease activity [Nocardia puris]
MAAIFWLVAGILLAAAEMLTGDLTLLMIGIAALGTAGVSAAADTSLVVDAIVFAVITAVLMLGVRPILRRRYSLPPAVPTNVDALQGKSALVLEEVAAHSGRVKLGGEEWTARPMNPDEVYEPGVTVYVMRIDGATAVVWKGP